LTTIFPEASKIAKILIAKAVFRDGYLTASLSEIRAALIVHFSIERGENASESSERFTSVRWRVLRQKIK